MTDYEKIEKVFLEIGIPYTEDIGIGSREGFKVIELCQSVIEPTRRTSEVDIWFDMNGKFASVERARQIF